MNSDSEKTVYFVRHGQSTDNRLPIFQNSTSELTDLGRIQCKELALELVRSGVKVDRTISSPLPRAAQSAQIINSIIGGKLEFLEQLSERKLPSILEGKPYSDKIASNLWLQWEDNFYKNIPIEDGETSNEIIKRAADVLEFIQNDQSNTLLVVTHGYYLRVIVSLALLGYKLDGTLLGTIQANLSTANAAVTTLSYKMDFQGNISWKLESFNNKLPNVAE